MRGAVVTLSGNPSRHRIHIPKRDTIDVVLFLFPAVALVVCFRVIPLLQGFLMSLTPNSASGMLSNYLRMLSDPIWLQALTNVGKGVLLLPLFILLPLGVAFALFNGVPGWSAYRAIYLLAYLLPAAISGLLFSLILGYSGPLNVALRALGLGPLAIPWLSNAATSMWSIYALVFWTWFGLGTVIYLAALAAIPEDQFEAARLDGASQFQMLWHITLPWARPTVGYWSVLCTSGLFLWLFPLITTATNGGPGYSSTTPEIYIYQTFSQAIEPGYASALGVALFAIVLVVSVFQVRWMYSNASEA
jgi:ABC-type sugar transport system permease subunit